MVAVALDALVTFTIEAALVGCWTAERDGEAAVEESVDLEAAGWWSGADGQRSCGMVEAAGWIGGMVAALTGRIGGFGGDLVAPLPAGRWSQIIYGAAILPKYPHRFICGMHGWQGIMVNS